MGFCFRVVWGVLVWVWLRVPPSHKATADKCSEGFDLRMGLSQCPRIKSTIIFYFF